MCQPGSGATSASDQLIWCHVAKMKNKGHQIKSMLTVCIAKKIKCSCAAGKRAPFVHTLHRYDMEKPNAFPLREPEFIKLPTTRMISSSWEKFWLLESSSQAAVTDTTSGLMLFSCSSNCSLNRMASSLTFNCFTVDIWQEWRGREVGMRCFLSMDKCVLWEY